LKKKYQESEPLEKKNGARAAKKLAGSPSQVEGRGGLKFYRWLLLVQRAWMKQFCQLLTRLLMGGLVIKVRACLIIVLTVVD